MTDTQVNLTASPAAKAEVPVILPVAAVAALSSNALEETIQVRVSP